MNVFQAESDNLLVGSEPEVTCVSVHAYTHLFSGMVCSGHFYDNTHAPFLANIISLSIRYHDLLNRIYRVR